MALTFETEFSSSLKRNNDVFPILSITGTSTIYLSTRDVTVDSQAYDGRLLNAPAITSSINLRNHTSRTNNITLRIANNGYDATFGQRTNKVVTIYFVTDGTTDDLDNCLKVFTGRVVGISKLTDKEIAVNCEDYASWRYNKILTSQVASVFGYNMSGVKTFRPVSYGDFTENTSTEASPGLCDTKKLFRPVHLIAHDRDYLYYDEGINHTGGRPHIYNDSIDRFIPIEQAQNDSHDKFNTNTIRVNNDDAPHSNESYFRHTIRLYASNSATTDDVPGAIDNARDASDAIDGDASSSVTCTASASGGLGNYVGTFAEYSGSLIGKIRKVTATIVARSTSGVQASCWIRAGDGATIRDEVVSTGNSWASSGAANLASAVTLTFTKDVTSVWPADVGVNLNGVIFGFYQYSSSGDQTLTVFEMYLDFTTYIPLETSGVKSTTQEYVPTLYLGADGTNLEGYTNISDHGPTEVHENILTNFGPGVSFIDTSTQGTVEANYNAAGLVRCTIDNPEMTVQDALNKLQKEAGFISYVRPSDGKVYYLIEDASSKTVTADLTTAMYRKPVFGTIPLSQMIWKVNYHYDKHPVKGTYLSGSYSQDTGTKSTYAFGDNDGVVTLNQDWVNETEAAANLLNLFKYQRMTAQCEILDPAKWTLEIGDIVTFSDPPADFRLRDSSAAYTDYQFRIIETTRTVNSLKIKAMEVYKA